MVRKDTVRKKIDTNYKSGNYLGANYTKDKTRFLIWSPTAEMIKVALYGKNGENYKNSPERIINMEKEDGETWILDVNEDLKGEYYNFLVISNGIEQEATDPYARAVGVNGKRGMIIDLSETNPKGWEKDKRPILDEAIDSILYEMHIRDFSIDENSGVDEDKKGKFIGACQENTVIPNTKVKTCIDHLKELGINTVHLMPVCDYYTVDESKLDIPQYNWGYDPQNYNVPEGSFSTNPFKAEIRIKEYKEMIMNFHKAGIRVVMDMVYNHTYQSYDSNLNKAAPDCYYRKWADGSFSNGSGCGNEISSERPMVRKFIVESVLYWVNEYHIDGFRFDLMGLTDMDTMKLIRNELDKIDKSLTLYGEGWTGGASPLPMDLASTKFNVPKYGDAQIAVFSDDMRDGVKGHVFNVKECGFANGNGGLEETIKFGIVASGYHQQIDYNRLNYSGGPWTNAPYQAINYVSAHDNYTLWDKLRLSCEGRKKEDILAINKLCAAIVFTSQGIPFIQAGEEFARSKVNPDGSFNDNSYNAPDSVNKLEWKRKEEYRVLFEYYKGLISLRKSHKAFRMSSALDVREHLNFLNVNTWNVVAYKINTEGLEDNWRDIIVLLNGRDEEIEFSIPKGKWIIVVNKEKAGKTILGAIDGDKIKLPSKSAYVLVDEESYLQTK